LPWEGVPNRKKDVSNIGGEKKGVIKKKRQDLGQVLRSAVSFG